MAYSTLMEQIQDIVLQLGSNDKFFRVVYSQMDSLKRKVLELKTIYDGQKLSFLLLGNKPKVFGLN
jgi:hypothetical protein